MTQRDQTLACRRSEAAPPDTPRGPYGLLTTPARCFPTSRTAHPDRPDPPPAPPQSADQTRSPSPPTTAARPGRRRAPRVPNADPHPACPSLPQPTRRPITAPQPACHPRSPPRSPGAPITAPQPRGSDRHPAARVPITAPQPRVPIAHLRRAATSPAWGSGSCGARGWSAAGQRLTWAARPDWGELPTGLPSPAPALPRRHRYQERSRRNGPVLRKGLATGKGPARAWPRRTQTAASLPRDRPAAPCVTRITLVPGWAWSGEAELDQGKIAHPEM
jgi:hypothetical protein